MRCSISSSGTSGRARSWRRSSPRHSRSRGPSQRACTRGSRSASARPSSSSRRSVRSWRSRSRTRLPDATSHRRSSRSSQAWPRSSGSRPSDVSLEQGLAKTRGGFLSRLFGRTREEPLTAEFLDELEEGLVRADLSVSLVDPLMAQVRDLATRVDVPIVSGRPDGDPAAVVFDAINAATARGNSIVIADTAGRLHTKGHLMDELGKIVRVAGRAREGAPDEVLLVLDGTAGQNAIQQARQFTSTAAVTGLVVTKLDGTAKGGAVFAIAQELGLPVKLLGVGEKPDDLVPMDPTALVNALLATN